MKISKWLMGIAVVSFSIIGCSSENQKEQAKAALEADVIKTHETNLQKNITADEWALIAEVKAEMDEIAKNEPMLDAMMNMNGEYILKGANHNAQCSSKKECAKKCASKEECAKKCEGKDKAECAKKCEKGDKAECTKKGASKEECAKKCEGKDKAECAKKCEKGDKAECAKKCEKGAKSCHKEIHMGSHKEDMEKLHAKLNPLADKLKAVVSSHEKDLNALWKHRQAKHQAMMEEHMAKMEEKMASMSEEDRKKCENKMEHGHGHKKWMMNDENHKNMFMMLYLLNMKQA